MQFKEEKIKNEGQGKWIITLDGEEYQDFLKRAKNRLKINLEIPGFRKGKAPESEIKKYLTPNRVYNEAFRLAIQPAHEFAWAQDPKLRPLTTPEPKLAKVNDHEMVVEFIFDIQPEIKLGQYKGLTNLEKTPIEVTDDEIDQVLKGYQDRFAMEKTRENGETIKKGDEVIFDFKGFVDGKPFQGGEAKDYKLVIGSGQFIPGFEESMTGLSHGEHKIKVTFPENYSAELGGKETEFALNIKEIKERKLPEIDNELVKDLNLKGVKNLQELKTKITNDIKDQKNREEKNRFVNHVLDEIVKTSDIQIPASAVNQQIKDLKKEFEQEITRQGLDLKTYKKLTKMTDADIDREIEADAKSRLATFLVVNEIKKAEKFVPTEADINQKYADLAKQFGLEVENLKAAINPEQVKQELESEMLTNFLFNNNGR
ncbi:trigger factor [Entomoplasma freundtii]|uniref:Trigger factor n=1 Tax=Entomoplasma freundtii TaxID=74700 RepID=A0A2K8NRJ5_9MOLU|nr:trigger factor [Entomoplasma freundtii]ATZ16394.1 trigger factor [Entomoplasma freundtii]TDY56567.1 trigger factor [Entomoplasma freundtii]